jgi:hypothetical protein
LVTQAELERAQLLRRHSAEQDNVWKGRFGVRKMKEELGRVERSKGVDHPDARKLRDLIESAENELSDSNR